MPDAPERLDPPADAAPRATYRFQFNREFPFPAGRDLAGYLGELGVSHVYASPILTARAGSIHGYDVVSYDAVNPELGGEDGFRAMAAALRRNGIGIILDIVPNHMAVGGADNALWLDLLRNGRASAFARWFDVDFDCPDPELAGKVHAPFLGEPYRDVLAAGGLALVARGDAPGHAIAHGEHLFPIRPEDEAEIEVAGIDAYRDVGMLDTLIAQQNFVLDWWRSAGDRINWRRFFDITQLAAMRMEEPAAFDAAHAVALRLYAEGLIDGLRVDHVDGLADPAGYCRTLRRELDTRAAARPDAGRHRAWLLVEKILATDEALPSAWLADGTTGYDFMDQVSALQHEPAGMGRLAETWSRISGRSRDFEAEETRARHEILAHSFDGQRERLIDALLEAGRDAAVTRAALRRAVTSLLTHLRVYRSYATGADDGVAAGEPFARALAAARREPLADRPALALVAAVMTGQGGEAGLPACVTAIRRFNQLSAPLAAKAVEDTAFYRHGRLLSRNDVGFDAGVAGLSPEAFHGLMRARAAGAPRSMLATATHDHKRGEDVRARLAVISELPETWEEATREWFALNAGVRPAGLDAGDEYMFYQMLVGAWPLGLASDDGAGLLSLSERLAGWQRKALREAKLRSGWAAPNEAHEADAERFVTRALSPGVADAFLNGVVGFVARIAGAGAMNGLVQLALRCTAPGVPDAYQGTEFWDFSLVDPDNRRPVDYAARRIALAQRLPVASLAQDWRDGRIKQRLLHKLLALRAAEPAIFVNGGYQPLVVEGERRRHALAFVRRAAGRAVIVIVALRCAGAMADGAGIAPDAAWWGDTRVTPPADIAETQVVIGPDRAISGTIPLGEALAVLPVAIWTVQCGP